jgi:hypothetical protein
MTDYSLALSRDRPSHDRDAFSRRHPKMSLQNRAKIFAPFDALPDLRWKVAERQKITRPPARLTEDARELLDRFHPVLYLSAPALFEALAEEAFGRGAGGTDTGLMTTCDLLIIDDLGTELTN